MQRKNHHSINFHFNAEIKIQYLFMLGITILGSNSAVPSFGRHPTAQIITFRDQLFLIDCGEGAQMQMNHYKIRKNRINHIFISHLHGDHYFGLIGLLSSMNLLGREQPIHIYAPAPLQPLLELQCKISGGPLGFTLHFYPLTKAEKIVDDKHVEVHCFPTKHSIECWGFLFKEKKTNRRINNNSTALKDIPFEFYKYLQQGDDYIKEDGAVIPNHTVTIEGTSPQSYAFCADTLYDEELLSHITQVNLLYHEATYLDEMHDKAAGRFHSTTKQAATIAQKAQAKRLLIGHFSSKYEKLDAFLEEAQTIFPNTSLALEGITYRM